MDVFSGCVRGGAVLVGFLIDLDVDLVVLASSGDECDDDDVEEEDDDEVEVDRDEREDEAGELLISEMAESLFKF